MSIIDQEELEEAVTVWLVTHEHYPDDPCYEADKASLKEAFVAFALTAALRVE